MIWVIIFSENLNVNDPLDGLYDPINRDKLPLAHVDVHPALKEACDDDLFFVCVNQPLGAHFLKILTVPPQKNIIDNNNNNKGATSRHPGRGAATEWPLSNITPHRHRSQRSQRNADSRN